MAEKILTVEEQNEKLKKELNELREQYNTASQQAGQTSDELMTMKSRMISVQKNLDSELSKREQVEAQNIILGMQLKDISDGGSKKAAKRPVKRDEESVEASKAATKIIRIVDQWMRNRDVESALLRQSFITDLGFSTLAQVFSDSPSLHTIDLSKNQLTMDSCSDICQIITSAPSLSYISLEGNMFSLRSIGYFMTAIMERENNKMLAPLSILHMQGNDGVQQAIEENEQPSPVEIRQWPKLMAYASPAPALLMATAKTLWKFLHDTGHPQVKDAKREQVNWGIMDPHTIRKIQSALSKILLISDEEFSGSKKPATISADQCIFFSKEETETAKKEEKVSAVAADGGAIAAAPAEVEAPMVSTSPAKAAKKSESTKFVATEEPAPVVAAKDKCQTFNLNQIITKTGTLLMNMLEKMLESTSIDARDVQTGRTLLEHACHTGNLALAKLCYRRGANLNLKALSGDTPFNIACKHQRYDILEFLHIYGVKINSADSEGRTALHVATAGNDVDALCRLVEWSADVNLQDKKQRTPLHFAAIGGHYDVCMLLLELGADLNTRDEKEYTAVAHAEANDHFKLMDRLKDLGGRGHGLQKDSGLTNIPLGTVKVSAGQRKATALARIGKYNEAALMGGTDIGEI